MFLDQLGCLEAEAAPLPVKAGRTWTLEDEGDEEEEENKEASKAIETKEEEKENEADPLDEFMKASFSFFLLAIPRSSLCVSTPGLLVSCHTLNGRNATSGTHPCYP